MTKVISVVTPQGTMGVPLLQIAHNRADYYMDVDGFAKYSNEWQAEVDYIMEDDFEGIDWFMNNMDWEEVKGMAVMLDDTRFCSSDMEYDQEQVEIKNV